MYSLVIDKRENQITAFIPGLGVQCYCICHNKKETALELVEEPVANAIHEIPPSSKEITQRK